MDWFSATGAIATTLFMVLVPGLVIGAILGLRRFTLIALAPLFTTTAIVLGTTAGGFLHIRWNSLVLAVTVIVLGVIALIANRILRRHNMVRRLTFGPRLSRWGLMGVVVAVVAIGVRVAYMIGWPENISQVFDVVFHLNAVQYILDTGNASPLTLANFNLSGFGHTSFYPAAWHGLTSLVAQASGSSVPVAISAVSIVTSAVVWPLGAVFLVRTLFGARRLNLVAAGILSTAFAVFPFLTLDWGVLYAFGFALTLSPAVIALVFIALKLSANPPLSQWMAIVALAASLPGLAVAHPTVLMFVVTVSIPAALVAVVRTHRQWTTSAMSHRKFMWMYLGLALGLTAAAVGFAVLRTGNFWGSTGTLFEALVKVGLNAPNHVVGPAWLLSALIVVGVVVMFFVPKLRWYLIGWVIFALLSVLSLGVANDTIRSILIGVWFGDYVRMQAMLAVLALPVAVFGFVWVADFLRRRWLSRVHARFPRAVAAIALVLLVVGTQFSNVNNEMDAAAERYRGGTLLTPDELKLLKEIPEIVPSGDVIAGNPWTGTPLVYTFSHREPLVNYMFHELPEYNIIAQHLQDALTDPAVCAFANEHRVRWVLDFGTQEVYIGHHIYKGYSNLEISKVVTLVKQEGDAKLYRITACDR